MTLQYRSSDGKLLYQRCGPNGGKLLAGCCCLSAETVFADCPATLTLTVGRDPDEGWGTWAFGAHTLTKAIVGDSCVYSGSFTIHCTEGRPGGEGDITMYFTLSCSCDSKIWWIMMWGPRNCYETSYTYNSCATLGFYTDPAETVCDNTGAYVTEPLFPDLPYGWPPIGCGYVGGDGRLDAHGGLFEFVVS